MKRFAATLPVMEDGPLAPPTPVPITILADSVTAAEQQTGDAGITLIGQLDTEGKLIKP